MKGNKKENTYQDISRELNQIKDRQKANRRKRTELEIQQQQVSHLSRQVDQSLCEMDQSCNGGARADLICQTREDHLAGSKRLNQAYDRAYDQLERERKSLDHQEEESTKRQRQVKQAGGGAAK